MKNSALLLVIFLGFCGSLYAGQTGYASWYGGKFHGRKTANGEIFDTYKYTAAHKTLPFDTVLRVTNLENGKSTVVRINDRGPFVEDRIIDLSFAAARELGIIEAGIARVSLEVVEGNGDKAEDYVYKIQVGAYSSRKNADAMIGRLGQAGLEGVIEKAASGVYRVLINNISRENLEKTEIKLKKNGISNYLLKKEIRL